MPKHKSKKEDSDSDSGSDDRGPIKKAKPEKNSNKSDDDDHGYSLGKNRFIKLSEFKGKWYVNIREYYNADGSLRPGKKGIMLTMEQWQKLKDFVADIDEDIKKNV